MRSPRPLLLWLLCVVPLAAATNGIDQSLEFLANPFNDGKNFIRWYGQPGRSYFVQVSDPADPLKTWRFANVIESGDDEPISHEVDGTADKGFFRLKYTDQVPGPNEDLDTADFDGDGLTNWEEINTYHTDPLNPDTDGDGFRDGEEVTAGTDALDTLSFPIKVIASLPIFQPDNDAYFGHPSGQPVILYLNQPLPSAATITSQWVIDVNGEEPVPVAGTTTILPGRQAIAFAPSGNSFRPWAENQESPPIYQIDFTPATTGLTHLMPFHKFFTTTTADGSLDCGPWIALTSPGSDFIDVACDTTLTAKWSEALDPATTIPANASLVPDGGVPVAISVEFDYGKDVNLLRITPAQVLVPATRYTVTLGTGFQSLTDKPHAQPVSWSFTTRPERPPPVVGAGPYIVAVSPSDFSFGIAPPNSVIVTFSEDMDPATLSSESIHLRAGNGTDLPGTFTYDSATYTLVFQPATAFPLSTYHTVTLDLGQIFNNAAEESGDRKALQGSNTYAFSTGQATGGGSTDGANGTPAPGSIDPLCIHFAWATTLGLGARSTQAAVIDSAPGCSVGITLIAKEGGSRVETLPPCTDALQVHESGPIAPATTVVITPRFVPGMDKHPDLTKSQVYILPSDATPPPGMTYLVLRTTPAVGENGAASVEYLGQFGVATSLTAGWVQEGTIVRGPQTLYLVPVPVERSIQGSGIWTLVEGQTAKALPGQKINLRLQDLYLSSYGPPGVTLNDWQWDIPDKSFRDYVVVFSDIDSATSGILTPFDKTETYCKEKDIYFYWSTSGAKPPNVGFEVLVGSEPFGHTSSTATMLVEKVDSRLTTKTGENKVAVLPPPFPEVQAFGFFSKAVGGDKYGIDYTGSVTTPSGWPAGKWNWVQLVKSHREFHNTTGTHTGMGDGTTSKLDTFYPYKPEPYSGNPLVAGSYPADASEHIDHDLPSEPLFGRVSIEVHETFETYLMFLPPGSGSRYVPLQQVGWVWGGIVSSADGWQAVTAQDQAAPVNPGGVEYSDHPQWDGNTKSDKEALIQ